MPNLSLTCYPILEPERMLGLLSRLPARAAVVYTPAQALAAQRAGYTVGAFLGDDSWPVEALNALHFAFLGDEPNINGPSGAYQTPEAYFEWAHALAQRLRAKGYRGHVVCAALSGIWVGWWIFRRLVPDRGYLEKLVALDAQRPTFDAWACNPFERTMAAWRDTMRAVVPGKPVYHAGWGFQRRWYQYPPWDSNPYAGELRALKEWPEVRVSSLWCLAPDGNYGHVELDGNLTLAGQKFAAAHTEV